MFKINVVVSIIFMCILSTWLCAEDLTKPIIIDPDVSQDTARFVQKITGLFYADTVIDKRNNAGSDSVGITRTGRNIYASLVCKNRPDTVLAKSFRKMFSDVSALAKTRDSAVFRIRAELLTFDIKETNKFLSQEMEATVKIGVTVKHAPNDSVVKQFSVTSQNVKKAIDTTRYAQNVLQQALRDCLQNILQTISQCKKGD